MDVIPTPNELTTLFKNGMLISDMARRFRLDSKEQVHLIEEQCVELHNAGTIDMLLLVESESFRALNESNFFAVMLSYCQILPELEDTPARMMACVETLVSKGGEDLSANQPNVAFRSWCGKKPHRANEVIVATHNNDELANRNLTFALEAINGIVEARRIALKYDGIRRLSAITALGRIEDNNSNSQNETLATYGKILDSGTDDNLRATLLRSAAATFIQKSDAPSSDEVTLIQRLLEDVGEHTLHVAAQTLQDFAKAHQSDIIVYLLNTLRHINSANKGTVNQLDYGLHALLKTEHGELATNYVTELLSQPDNQLQLKEFDSYTSALITGSQGYLSHVVVKWLLRGTPCLCEGLSNAIQGQGMEGIPLKLCAEDLMIPPIEQIFICRKAIGFFFMKPTTAASVVVSVLRVCNPETAHELQKLLVDPLLLNYSGVRDYLNEITNEDAAKKYTDQAISLNEAYLKAQRDIPIIKELSPSEHHRRIEHLRWSDQMRDAYKDAKNQSVFLSMVSQSVLLYGKTSLSFAKGGDGKLRPMEMELQPHEVSFEMPRMQIADPIGLDLILRIFRNEKIRMES